MYSLDVNFLKDRPDYQQQDSGRESQRRSGQMGALTPLIVGVAVGCLLPGIVGGLWFYLRQQNAQLQERNAALDGELGRLGAREQEIEQIQNQTQQVNAETEALATVFNQIKPWSALLEDIRERIPPGVQISTIQQSEVAPEPPADPEAQEQQSALPSIKLDISGTASSFDDVNYFLLTLQRSPFIEDRSTRLTDAQLIDNPTQLEVPENQAENATEVIYELPKVVDYGISATLSDIPASELIRELDRKGAVGLVNRIRTLQEKGVIQP
jgi:type IV pilus assembly protein PilN